MSNPTFTSVKSATAAIESANVLHTEGQAAASYERPQRFELGSAVDLVQSYSWGAYEDRYTGYKWNR
jgi:hypothetical protein